MQLLANRFGRIVLGLLARHFFEHDAVEGRDLRVEALKVVVDAHGQLIACLNGLQGADRTLTARRHVLRVADGALQVLQHTGALLQCLKQVLAVLVAPLRLQREKAAVLLPDDERRFWIASREGV